MTIQDSAASTNVMNEVADCTGNNPVGSMALRIMPKSVANALTVVALLNGAPVIISTPMIMPTVAAAAPTESAHVPPALAKAQ